MNRQVGLRGGGAVTLIVTVLAVIGIRPVNSAAQEAATVHLTQPDQIANASAFGPAARFEMVTGVRELPDGRVLAADLLAARLVLIDWDRGEAVPMQAPSQIADAPQPLWLFPLYGDSTLVTNASTREWVVLEDTLPVRFFAGSDRLPALMGPALYGATPEGRVLGTRRHPYDTERGPSDTYVALLAQYDHAAIDTIAYLRGPAQFAGDSEGITLNGRMFYVSNQYQTAEMAHLFSDGWIAVARMDPYRVEWRSPDGQWVRGDPLPFTGTPVDDDERCFVLEIAFSLLTARYGEIALDLDCDLAAHVEWPEIAPAFKSYASFHGAGGYNPTLWPTPEGHLLIRRTAVSHRPETRYDVVDRSGDLIARLVMPQNVAIVGFGRSMVYTVEMDDDARQTLRRHRWRAVVP